MTTTTEPTTVVALTNRQIHVLLAALDDRLDKLDGFSHHRSAAEALNDLAAEISDVEDLLRQANARLPRDSERTQ